MPPCALTFLTRQGEVVFFLSFSFFFFFFFFFPLSLFFFLFFFFSFFFLFFFLSLFFSFLFSLSFFFFFSLFFFLSLSLFFFLGGGVRGAVIARLLYLLAPIHSLYSLQDHSRIIMCGCHVTFLSENMSLLKIIKQFRQLV